MKIRVYFLLGLGIVLLVPPACFVICGMVSGLPLAEVSDALIIQYGSGAKPSLWASSVLGLAPLVVFAVVLWLMRRMLRREPPIRAFGLAALLALAAVLVWCNVEAWTTFFPARSMPGWPHGLELVIGPLFFAPVAMLIAIVAAGLVLSVKR